MVQNTNLCESRVELSRAEDCRAEQRMVYQDIGISVGGCVRNTETDTDTNADAHTRTNASSNASAKPNTNTNSLIRMPIL